MVETADIPVSNTAAPMQHAAAMATPRPEHTKIKGRFNQYVSAFWTFVLPLFTTRYIFQPLFDMMGWTDDRRAIARRTDDLNKSAMALQPFMDSHPRVKEYAKRSFAIVAGVGMLAATAFYGLKTLGDMRRTLSEALAHEFGKNPKDINIRDLLFRKTDNDVVRIIRSNFFKYNARRLFFVNSPFFSFLVPFFGLNKRLSTENAVRLGIGSGAAYLVSDVLTRKETFFEELQVVIDRKINQVGRVGEQITAIDLINLYDRNARDYSPQIIFSDKINTPVWNQNMPVFERMAELMNETYHPQNGRKSNFTIPTFVYLVGHRLIQAENPEKTLACIEIANSYGIPGVKQALAEFDKGTPIEVVMQQFPVAPRLPSGPAREANSTSFAEQLGETRPSIRPAAPAASQAEKLAQKAAQTPVQGLH